MASNEEAPPEGYGSRTASTDDLPAIDDLYIASERVLGIRPEPRSGYLGWRWSQGYVDLETDTRVVVGHGGLAAFAMAFVEPGAPSVVACMGRVHPDHAGQGLGGWALAYFDARAAAAKGVTTLRLGLQDEDADGHALVAAAGYERVRTSFDMGVRLAAGERPGPTPDGVTIRDFVPGEERMVWRIVGDAFRDHWDHEEDETYEVFHGDWFQDPGHPPRILVAEVGGVPDGVIAWIVDHDVPYVFSVGVRQRARGRGVATSLLEHAKAVAAADGYDEMTLSVDAENPTGAVRAYEKVGMSVNRTTAVYQKAVR